VIGIGVVGYGYWGPNLVRNFAETPEARVVAVSDLRPERLALVRQRHPLVEATADAGALLGDSRVDAVVVATPVSTHFGLAMQALRAGKHVLVEKPLASTSDEALRLIDEADRRGLVLMVDHTFVYTGAVRKMQELVAGNVLGRIHYYDSVRVNLGLFQHDVNVIWDLAVHDVAIVDHVLPAKPVAVSATGISHVAGTREDIAYLTLLFDGPLIAHIHASWLAPLKIRRTLLGGSRRMIVYDDLEPSEKVKVYDKGVLLDPDGDPAYQLRVAYRSGDMWAPRLDTSEALRTETSHFLQAIVDHAPVLTDGHAGLRVVRVLEAATESLAERGQVVELDTARLAA